MEMKSQKFTFSLITFRTFSCYKILNKTACSTDDSVVEIPVVFAEASLLVGPSDLVGKRGKGES